MRRNIVLKIAKFPFSPSRTVFLDPLTVSLLEFRGILRFVNINDDAAIPEGEKWSIHLAVLSLYRHLSNRQADGQALGRHILP